MDRPAPTRARASRGLPRSARIRAVARSMPPAPCGRMQNRPRYAPRAAWHPSPTAEQLKPRLGLHCVVDGHGHELEVVGVRDEIVLDARRRVDETAETR